MTNRKHEEQLLAQSVRQKVLALLKNKYSTCNWLQGLIFSDFQNGIRISFIHSYFASWFKQNAKAHFETIMRQHFPDLEYEYYIDSEIPRKFSRENFKPQFKQKRKITGELQQNPFACFICSEKNAPALQTLEKIANATPDSPRGIVIYGISGVGKSMLLKILAEKMTAKGKKAIFMNAVEFCGSRASAPYENIYAGSFWQNIDALILDDLQTVAKYPHFADKLANFLDRHFFPENKKKLFAIFSMTSKDKGNEFHPRLQNRLDEMLWLELKEADLETKLKYVEQINRLNLLKLNRSQILSLIREAQTFPALKGLLARIEFLKKHSKTSLTDEAWEQLNIKHGENALQWKNLVELTGRHFHLKPDEILGNSRKAEHVRARQIALYLCRKYLGFSFKELGALFGGRDHSTVMHGIKKVQQLKDTDKDMHNQLQELENNPIFADNSGSKRANR